jgi:hypothetical protein
MPNITDSADPTRAAADSPFPEDLLSIDSDSPSPDAPIVARPLARERDVNSRPNENDLPGLSCIRELRMLCEHIRSTRPAKALFIGMHISRLGDKIHGYYALKKDLLAEAESRRSHNSWTTQEVDRIRLEMQPVVQQHLEEVQAAEKEVTEIGKQVAELAVKTGRAPKQTRPADVHVDQSNRGASSESSEFSMPPLRRWLRHFIRDIDLAPKSVDVKVNVRAESIHSSTRLDELVAGLIRPDEEVAFPLDEAKNRVRSRSAIAADEGLTLESPALQFALRSFKIPSAIAFGAIFGLSIGLLVGALDPTMATINLVAFLKVAAIFCVIGILMFVAIGHWITVAAAYAAEERYQAALVKGFRSRELNATFFGRSAKWILAFVLLGTVAIVGIESVVDRFGVISMFIDQIIDSDPGGKGALGVMMPTPLALICLAMVSSLPFVLLSATVGYVRGRGRTLELHIAGVQELETYELADSLHRQRLTDADSLQKEYADARRELDPLLNTAIVTFISACKALDDAEARAKAKLELFEAKIQALEAARLPNGKEIDRTGLLRLETAIDNVLKVYGWLEREIEAEARREDRPQRPSWFPWWRRDRN